VLAFSVSARRREFGIRLAVGSAPRQLLTSVVSEGVAIAGIGIATGAGLGLIVARAAARFVEHVDTPDAFPVLAAALILIVAAAVASLLPAERAASVDVVQALRSE
jgi:ABC-type antimicrobial peptide transport system permease subunit